MKTNLCFSCGRKCGVNRNVTLGFCEAGNKLKIAQAGLHFGEEPCISGKNGSGTVFFSHCSLKCVYCQNNKISHDNFGKEISVKRLSEIFKELEILGANNINLVTPTHYIDLILQAIDIYKPNIPIVYNTSGYDSLETINKALKFSNIFLFDLKYLSNEKSEKYSFAYNYPKYATNSIKACINRIPNAEFNKNGIMQKGIIIRHLLLPQGTNEAIKIIDWIKENANNCYFSLMSQYVPFGNLTDYKELNRKITAREYEKVVNYLINSNLENVFLQDLTSSSKKFTPPFDLSGV